MGKGQGGGGDRGRQQRPSLPQPDRQQIKKNGVGSGWEYGWQNGSNNGIQMGHFGGRNDRGDNRSPSISRNGVKDKGKGEYSREGGRGQDRGFGGSFGEENRGGSGNLGNNVGQDPSKLKS